MKVAIVQTALIQGRVARNMQIIQDALTEAALANPDVIVLPELWNTSFLPENVHEIADIDGKETRALLSTFAKSNHVNIVGGSVANIRGNDLFNTVYVYDREGSEIAAYDKAHLFSPAGENDYFKAGTESVTFELDGVTCGVITCYDLRFPEWVRELALADAQVVFVPAAWPATRNVHWDVLNRARAIENQMYVVAVNSIGLVNPTGDVYGGHSVIVDPWGSYIVEPDDDNEIKVGEIDFDVIDGIRSKINVFNDRRPDIYTI
jgi:predicted amidohydrolase